MSSGNERHPQLRVHRVVWEMSQGGDQKLGNSIETELLLFLVRKNTVYCLLILWIHTMHVLAYMTVSKAALSLTSNRNTISHSFIPSHIPNQNIFQGAG